MAWKQAAFFLAFLLIILGTVYSTSNQITSSSVHKTHHRHLLLFRNGSSSKSTASLHHRKSARKFPGLGWSPSNSLRNGKNAGGKCTRNGFMRCLNLANPFEISELVSSIGYFGDFNLLLRAPMKSKEPQNLREGLSKICAATIPVVYCLSDASCLDNALTNKAAVWKSVFTGARGSVARLLPKWIKSLRYLPVACNILKGKQASSNYRKNQVKFNLRSLDKCPGLTTAVYVEKCKAENIPSTSKLAADPAWKLDPLKNSRETWIPNSTLQWIDFQFFDLLNPDDSIGQVNFSAMPAMSERDCVYLNQNVDCFAVQVFRFCPESLQNSVLSALLKFINFQLLLTDNNCPLLSENVQLLRHVLFNGGKPVTAKPSVNVTLASLPSIKFEESSTSTKPNNESMSFRKNVSSDSNSMHFYFHAISIFTMFAILNTQNFV